MTASSDQAGPDGSNAPAPGEVVLPTPAMACDQDFVDNVPAIERVLNWMLGRRLPPREVPDAVQDVLAIMWRRQRSRRLQSHPSAMRAFAVTTAEYETRRRWRHDSRFVLDRLPDGEGGAADRHDPNPDPEAQLLADERYNAWLAWIATLPSGLADVARLHFLEELSEREIAARLGVSEQVVRTRICRVRIRAREEFRPGARRGYRANKTASGRVSAGAGEPERVA